MSKRRSLFSKFKSWCSTHRASVFLIPVIAVLLGIAFLIVGGTLAGWNIVSALTSSTAVLVYCILLLIVIVAVSHFCVKRLK